MRDPPLPCRTQSTLAAALLAVSFVVLRALSSFTKACCWAALQAHFNHVAVSKVTGWCPPPLPVCL